MTAAPEYAQGGIIEGEGEPPAWIRDANCGYRLTAAAAEARAFGTPILQRINEARDDRST